MKMHLLPCGRLKMRKSIFLPAAERSETIELPVSSALLRHSRANVLFDTGCHPAVPEDPEARWGGYGQAIWRIDRNWEVGGRYDNAPAPVAFGGGTQETWTALGTWYGSEFFRLRIQPSLVLLPERQTGFQGLASFEFTIGAHAAHPF